MSCYLCSSETISLVSDCVCEHYNITTEKAFDELLTYNKENLEKRYHEPWGDYPREYKKLEYSKAQQIQSIRNYLYQTDDYVDNELIQWLNDYSNEHYDLIKNATEKLHWDYEDAFLEEEEPETKPDLFSQYNGDIKEIAKQIRKDLKAEFGKTAKFSVRCHKFSGGQEISITIKNIDEKYCYTEQEYLEEHLTPYLEEWERDLLYNNLKRYHIVKPEVIDKIKSIHRKYNYVDSDPYTDYYNCGYYGEASIEGLIEKEE